MPKGNPGQPKSESHKRHIRESRTTFGKGHIPWNKGKKGVQVGWKKGFTKETHPSLAHQSAVTKGIPRPWVSIWNSVLKKGTKLSKKRCLEISKAIKLARKTHSPAWNTGLTKETDKRVKALGVTISKVTKGKPRPHRSRKQGTRRFWYYGEDCRIKMRSRWEVAYAHYLDRKKVKWLYECTTFILDKFSYTPDFYLIDENKFIEIKGFEDWKCFKKHCKVINHYGINLVIVREYHLTAMGALI